MKQSTLIWVIVMVIAGVYLSWRAVSYQAGAVYVAPKVVTSESSDQSITTWSQVSKVERENSEVVISWPRTIGVWLSALFTLAIFSFLIGDNVCYKIAESIFVGASAGYAMVVGFWTAFMGIFVAQLAPQFAKNTFMPMTDRTEPDWLMLIPLAMGIMFLWRL